MTDHIPEGWAWATIAEVTERVPNTRPEDFPNKEFSYIDISSIDNSRFVIAEKKQFKGKDAPSRARRPIRSNDVLFSNVRTYLRNIALIEPTNPAQICSTGFTVLRPNSAIDPRFLFRYVLTNAFIDKVTPQQTGTHYPATSDRVVMSERIPLAPRAEQQRIVERLERLFVEVDRSKSRMAKIPVLLKRFHQSVLAAACSGRITADWRDFRDRMPRTEVVFRQIRERRLKAASSIKQRQVIEDIYSAVEENDSDMLPQGWAFTYLNKLAESFDYGTSTKSSNEGTVPVLRMGNIQGGTIDWSDLVYTSDEEEIEKYALEPNTVLFNRTNSPELVGKTALYRGERPALFAGYLIRVNAVPELDPEYLNLCLNSPAAREFCSQVKTDGVSQSNINAQKLGTFEVPFCSLAEQQEIVRRVAKLFALANRIESRYDAAKKRIDPLTQSILAKAFRGELVPTEAALAEAEGRSFESAEELLNMIRRRDSTAEKPRLVRSSGRGH